uniref:Peptidoglycan-recognition protein n=1 Tax=Protaetia brevitarsis TaxID=348688 RepID=A0A5P8I4I3_PROBE|nr:peptigosaccharide recognition protein lb [Protaetia brevitarsis]
MQIITAGDLVYRLAVFVGITSSYDLQIVSKEEWGAMKPVEIDPMPNPVPYVIIHHSYIPPACNTSSECVEAMQWMQDFHMNTHGWNDIGYHFAVGGDGKAYEGRGWSAVGAHAPLYNNRSIGICIIGDWTTELPPIKQLNTVHNLINFGVESGYIRPEYILHGHRQVRSGTECPGDRLFEEIKSWPHFSNEVDVVSNKTGKKA